MRDMIQNADKLVEMEPGKFVAMEFWPPDLKEETEVTPQEYVQWLEKVAIPATEKELAWLKARAAEIRAELTAKWILRGGELGL